MKRAGKARGVEGREGREKEASADSNSRSLPAETGYSVFSVPSAINPSPDNLLRFEPVTTSINQQTSP